MVRKGAADLSGRTPDGIDVACVIHASQDDHTTKHT
jgi:hypothetical protein